MFAKARGQRGHDRSTSAAAAPSSHVPPHASPLSANFDSAPLPPPIFQPTRQVGGESLQRPGTSDGLGARPSNRTNGLRLTSAPVLPPIPRVASRYEPATSDRNRAREDGDSGNAPGLGRALDQSKQRHSVEHPLSSLRPEGLPMHRLRIWIGKARHRRGVHHRRWKERSFLQRAQARSLCLPLRADQQ